ncbi:hypothetical protein [Moorena producens]|nr:hypothetical protein [Moorena producens]
MIFFLGTIKLLIYFTSCLLPLASCLFLPYLCSQPMIQTGLA